MWRVDGRLETARREVAFGTVRGLITLAAAEAAIALIAVAVAMRPAIVAVAVFTARRSVPVETVTAEILPVTPIVAVEALVIAALMTTVVEPLLIMPRLAVFVAVLIVEVALLRMGLLGRLTLDAALQAARLLRLTEFIGLIVAELIPVTAFGPGQRMRAGSAVAERIHAALSHLLAVAQNDAVIVLGMLQIIFSKNRVTG